MNELLERLKTMHWDDKAELYRALVAEVEHIHTVNDAAVSVVVISWRLHPDTILNFQKLALQRSRMPFQLIFVNNGGTNAEFESLKPYVDVYIRLNNNSGAYMARNIGAVFAEAPLFLFLEDDGIPDDDLIESHWLAHESFDAIAVKGAYLCRSDHPGNWQQNHYYTGEKFFPAFSSLEGNSSYQADLFRKVGGWDDNIRFGHGGLDLAIRLLNEEPDKRKQIYSPISIIHHDYVKQNKQQMEEKRRKQNNAFAYMLQKHPDLDRHVAEWQRWYGDEKEVRVKSAGPTRSRLEALRRSVFERNVTPIQWTRGPHQPAYDFAQVQHLVHDLQRSGRRCVLFGAGWVGRLVSIVLKKNGLGSPVRFVDNDSSKWGTLYDGSPVSSPDSLVQSEFVIITSMWYEQISAQLEAMGWEVNRDYIIMK